MIEPQCFERDWILAQRQKLGGVDPALLEKTILAFELLGRLTLNGLSFVFKGGTSLLLLLEEFKRLSIDVDIVCEEDKRRQWEIFDILMPSSPFSHWVEDPRTPSGIPKKHYKFYFESQINRREDYVLLDVLKSPNLYPALQQKPIEFPFIQTRGKVSVAVPSIDSLIGDKLTAFAPRTIGVPLDTRRSMQIIKQLFDLGELFPKATNLEEISSSYNAFIKNENNYRKTAFNRQETLQDTIDTCFLIAQLDLKKSVENDSTALLRRGIRQIGSHLLGVPFGLMQAKEAASRVAFLSALLAAKTTVNIRNLFYSNDRLDEIRNVKLTGHRSRLNRLKGISPESFYYWYLADRHITDAVKE